MSFAKRVLRWMGTLLLVGGCGVGFLAWQGLPPVARGRTREAVPPKNEDATKKAPVAVAVTVAPVTGRVVQRRVQVVGSLHGTEEIEVASKVDGRVVRIVHDVGDVVHPGEVLLEVDPTDLRLAMAEATRALELELARIGLAAVPSGAFDISSLPGVTRARLIEKNARNKFERSQALLKRQSISREDLEQSETDFDVAQANTRQAVLDAEAAIASIRQREALLDTARQKLQDARIVVPTPSVTSARMAQRIVPVSAGGRGKQASAASDVEYVVAARMVSEGEMVHDAPSSTIVFRLVMDRPLKLKANVPERYAGEVAVGQLVEVSVEAWPAETFEGTIARVNPTVDRDNRTFEIEVRIPNEDRRLRAGSFAKAALLTREESRVPTIPEEALVRFAGVVKVFVVAGDVAHAVPVETGLRLEVDADGRPQYWQEVKGHLQLDDFVVTSGHSQLAEGTPVRVREPKATQEK